MTTTLTGLDRAAELIKIIDGGDTDLDQVLPGITDGSAIDLAVLVADTAQIAHRLGQVAIFAMAGTPGRSTPATVTELLDQLTAMDHHQQQAEAERI